LIYFIKLVNLLFFQCKKERLRSPNGTRESERLRSTGLGNYCWWIHPHRPIWSRSSSPNLKPLMGLHAKCSFSFFGK